MAENVLKIRKTVIAFSLVLAFMLYQTGNSSMGTIVAMVTMALTVLSSFFERGTFVNDGNQWLIINLFLFIFVVFATTVVRPNNSWPSVSKFIYQAFLCLALIGVSINEKENRYLKFILEVAAVVYSFFIIRYCLSINVTRLIHGDIEMFGSSFDPNYIGIPLVLSSVVMLDDFFKARKTILKLISISAWLFVTLAIIQTSSRGNSLSFILSNGLILLSNARLRRFSSSRLLLFILLGAGLIFAFQYVSSFWEDNIARMTSFEDGADNGRLDLWLRSIQIWESNPLFGVGLGGVTAETDLCSHNTYLQVLAETGLVGFLLFSSYIYLLYRNVRIYDQTLSIVFISLLIQIFFLNALDNRCFWAILSWIAMVPNRKINYIRNYAHKNSL